MNNQCDGCQRGIPVVNGIHKDEQGFGMGCSRARYTTSHKTIQGVEYSYPPKATNWKKELRDEH